MRQIGVRELRQNASEYLRLVQTGESFDVSDHGRQVAQLVPLAKRGKPSSHYDRLIREGRLKPPAGKSRWQDLPPITLPPGSRTVSEYLQEMRADER
jgi:prevent-host-death family protein